MDPNEVLKKIRKLAKRLNDTRIEPADAEAGMLAEAVADLDEWMSNGGYMPVDWNSAYHPPQPPIAPETSALVYQGAACLNCGHARLFHCETADGPACSGDCTCRDFFAMTR